MSLLNLFSRAGNEGDCPTSIPQPGRWCLEPCHAKVQLAGVLRKSRPKGRNSPGLNRIMRRGTSGSSGRKRQGDARAGKLLAKQLAAEVKEAFGSGATESDSPAKETGVETPVKLEGEAARP